MLQTNVTCGIILQQGFAYKMTILAFLKKAGFSILRQKVVRITFENEKFLTKQGIHVGIHDCRGVKIMALVLAIDLPVSDDIHASVMLQELIGYAKLKDLMKKNVSSIVKPEKVSDLLLGSETQSAIVEQINYFFPDFFPTLLPERVQV